MSGAQWIELGKYFLHADGHMICGLTNKIPLAIFRSLPDVHYTCVAKNSVWKQRFSKYENPALADNLVFGNFYPERGI